MVCGEVTSAVASDARPDGECVAMMRPWRSTRMVHVQQPYQVRRIAFSEATVIDTLSGYALRALYGLTIPKFCPECGKKLV